MEEPPPTDEVTMGTVATEEITLEPVTPQEAAVDDAANEALGTGGTVGMVADVDVIDLGSPIKMTPRANRKTLMSIGCLPKGLIDVSHKLEHVQFWKDMGLYDFVNLDWEVKTGTDAQVSEFIANSIPVATMVDGHLIDLTEDNLGEIFKLGIGCADIASRARPWDSKKFSVAKDKNGYKLSHCTDPLLVERLDYMHITLYPQDRKNIITGVQVPEVEEVRGGSTNWMKHFAGTFHQHLAMARSTKKTKLGNHIRVILRSMEWIDEEQVGAPPGYPTVMVAKHLGKP
ncbi:unnamed protein product [Calypogeia fissa]